MKRLKILVSNVEKTLGRTGGSKFFSKLDAQSGFQQIILNKESAKYATFITPFECYNFNRLPYRITSAPELFQNAMNELLDDLNEALTHMDEMLIHRHTREILNE